MNRSQILRTRPRSLGLGRMNRSGFSPRRTSSPVMNPKVCRRINGRGRQMSTRSPNPHRASSLPIKPTRIFARVSGPGRQKSTKSSHLRRERRLWDTDPLYRRWAGPASAIRGVSPRDMANCRNSRTISVNQHLAPPRAMQVRGGPAPPKPPGHPLARRLPGTSWRASAPAS